MKKKEWAWFCIVLLGLAALSEEAASTFAAATPHADTETLPAGVKVSLLLPAYWGSDSEKWTTLIKKHVPGTIAIANYDAGPPTSYDAAFETVVEQARAAGIRVIGYVPTGSHDTARIHAMIDSWYSYKMDGIFLDEATITQSTADVGYYQDLYRYIKAKKGPTVINTLDVLNAGWLPASSDYLKDADVIMAVEATTTNFQKYWQTPDWMRTTSASRFSATLEAVDSKQVKQWVQTLVEAHFGYIYLTETIQGYGIVPAIYTDEVNAINSVNGAG